MVAELGTLLNFASYHARRRGGAPAGGDTPGSRRVRTIAYGTRHTPVEGLAAAAQTARKDVVRAVERSSRAVARAGGDAALGAAHRAAGRASPATPRPACRRRSGAHRAGRRRRGRCPRRMAVEHYRAAAPASAARRPTASSCSRRSWPCLFGRPLVGCLSVVRAHRRRVRGVGRIVKRLPARGEPLRGGGDRRGRRRRASSASAGPRRAGGTRTRTIPQSTRSRAPATRTWPRPSASCAAGSSPRPVLARSRSSPRLGPSPAADLLAQAEHGSGEASCAP